MKKLLVVTLALVSISASAIVGNVGTKRFMKLYKATSEAEAIQIATDAIPSIVNATDSRVFDELYYGNCFPLTSKYIKIEGMKVKKSYEYVNGEFQAVYTARVDYLHTACRISNR